MTGRASNRVQRTARKVKTPMDNGSEFKERVLTSGVQVVGQPMDGVQSAALGILIGAGARHEQPRQFGISHVVEQLLLRGTTHLDARQLSDALDSLGISYDSSSGVEMTLVSAVMLGDRLEAGIDLLADVVRYPSFPEDALETVRALISQERRQREDQPGQRVMDLLRQNLYAGNPVSHDVLGTEDTVRSLTRDEITDFWSERYTTNNMVISVAGNFEWDAVIDQLERITATWPSGAGRPVVHEPATRSGVTVLSKETTQENLGFAFPAVPVTDPHYYAGRLMTQILGGGMNSRLFQEVREKRGLAYAVHARFDTLERAGFVRIYVGTSADRAHESVEVVMAELDRLVRGGVTEDELALAKTRVKSQVIMRSESTLARMSSNLRTWWYEQQLHSLDSIRDLIDHVTVEEIGTLLESLRPVEHLTVVGLGPKTQEELFGGVLARS